MSEAYREAGVNIEAADEAVARLRRHVAATWRPEVFGGFGGFGGGFALDVARYREPVLVSGTDGVGTKLLVAQMAGVHDSVGIDCVAMCVNDVLVQGAEPLFFLDYVAVGRVEPARLEAIVAGVARGCTQAGCALVGGETAEMPGLYAADEYDLAGFAVGVVERSRYLTGQQVRPGDVVLGLASAGLHANGYALARRILFDDADLTLHDTLPGCQRTVAQELLIPTRIYVHSILTLLMHVEIHAMAHITGGGLLGNVGRALPTDCQAVLDARTWDEPAIFAALQARASQPLSATDLYTTWNMGIGYVCIVAPQDVPEALRLLREAGEDAREIGRITHGQRGVRIETPHSPHGSVERLYEDVSPTPEGRQP